MNRPSEFFRAWAEQATMSKPKLTARSWLDRLETLLRLMYRLGQRDAADELGGVATRMAADGAMTELEGLWSELDDERPRPSSKYLPSTRLY